jgi:hypothetical protein
MYRTCTCIEIQPSGPAIAQVVHGKQHFQSLHSKFGLATFIMAIVAPLGGLVSFRRLGLLQRVPDKLQPRIKWLHRNVSLCCSCTSCTWYEAQKLWLCRNATCIGQVFFVVQELHLHSASMFDNASYYVLRWAY